MGHATGEGGDGELKLGVEQGGEVVVDVFAEGVGFERWLAGQAFAEEAAFEAAQGAEVSVELLLFGAADAAADVAELGAGEVDDALAAQALAGDGVFAAEQVAKHAAKRAAGVGVGVHEAPGPR
jgi:hypothetical protein